LSKAKEILTANVSWSGVQTLQILWKSCKGYAPVGVYIPQSDQISVKISVLGVLYPNHCTNGVKFGMEEGTCGPSSMPNFTLISATCRPCGTKKPQNRPE